MEAYSPLILFISAFIISTVGNIVGIGGGIFLIPVLMILAEVPLTEAIGISAVSLLVSSSVASFISYKKRAIDFKVAFRFEPFAVMGAFVGALLTSYLHQELLLGFFSIYLIFMSQRFLSKTKKSIPRFIFQKVKRPYFKKASKKDLSSNLVLMSLSGVFAGLLAGIFGIGGGVVKMPILIGVFNLLPQKAVSTSVFMICITSLVSAIVHYNLGNINFRIALSVISAFALGGLIGVFFKNKLNDRSLEVTLGVVMIVIAMYYLISVLILK